MKLTPWYLAALATVVPIGALAGASGALAGHVAILAITLSIFYGTLTLGRSTSTSTDAGSTPK